MNRHQLVHHIKDAVLPFLQEQRTYRLAKRLQLTREYRATREHYQAVLRSKHLRYQPQELPAIIRAHLAARGYTPVPRSLGQVHTLACIPQLSWHHQLLVDLKLLGPVSLFDWRALGYTWESLKEPANKTAAGHALVDEAVRVHAQKPIDWIFMYTYGDHLRPATLTELHERVGVPVVNMWLDDKQRFRAVRYDDGALGNMAGLAAGFDLAWTSSRLACDWYLAEGGRPIFLPEGTLPELFSPGDEQAPYRFDVSFVGAAYGFRKELIAWLRRRGLRIETFGYGWPEGEIDEARMLDVLRSSRIVLGAGGVGYSEQITTLKGRDFDVPAVGRALYLTTYNPELNECFDGGREIAFYRTRDDILELVRYYLDRPQAAQAMAQAGRRRVLREHRWLHRYQKILEVLGIVGTKTEVAHG